MNAQIFYEAIRFVLTVSNHERDRDIISVGVRRAPVFLYSRSARSSSVTPRLQQPLRHAAMTLMNG